MRKIRSIQTEKQPSKQLWPSLLKLIWLLPHGSCHAHSEHLRVWSSNKVWTSVLKQSNRQLKQSNRQLKQESHLTHITVITVQCKVLNDSHTTCKEAGKEHIRTILDVINCERKPWLNCQMQIYAAYSHTMPGHILTRKGLYLERNCFALSARVAEVTEVKMYVCWWIYFFRWHSWDTRQDGWA